MKDIRHFTIEGLSRPITLIDCHDLTELFPVIFPGWQFNELSETTDIPILTLQQVDASYILEAGWLDKPIQRKGRVAAICALVAELVRAYVNDDKEFLCLHAAAAEFDSKLVIFPNQYRAGKSILSACLAASGVTLFGDDVLPISLSEGQGIAAGLAPRLRIPLPDNLSAETQRFIDANAVVKSRQYAYLDLKGGLLATRHNQAPIGAFVLLEREEGITPVLEAVTEAEVLHQVVWQNFAREADAPQILERLSQIVANAKRYRLRYDRAEDAVTLLKSTFRDWPQEDNHNFSAPLLSQQTGSVMIEVPSGCYLRKAGIGLVSVDGEGFLADADGAAIHHLNAIGCAIWNLLVEPSSIDEVVELLFLAFPEAGRSQLENDVGSLISSLLSKNLLITSSTQDAVRQASTN